MGHWVRNAIICYPNVRRDTTRIGQHNNLEEELPDSATGIQLWINRCCCRQLAGLDPCLRRRFGAPGQF